MGRPEDEDGGLPGYVVVLNWHVRAPGGVSRVVGSICVELGKLGWAPAILVNDWNAKSPQLDRTGSNPVISWRMRPPWDEVRPFRNAIACVFGLPARTRTWLSLARKNRWRVVNFHFPGVSAAFWLLLRALGIWRGVMIASVHGGEVRAALISKDRVATFLLRRVLIEADAIVACAEGLAADVIALAPEARERVRVIHNGVDFRALLNEVAPDFVLPQELKWKPYILNVATYEPKKSQETLIQSFSIAAARHRDVQLVIIGRRTPYAETIEALAAASDFADRIHLLEDLPHNAVMDWMSRATIFCLPSISEGHPLAIMEAAAFELPVVATSIAGTRDIVAGDDEGLLVPVGDHQALGNALNQLLEDPEAAGRLGRNLRRSVESRYSWAKTTQEYSDLARSLMAANGRSSGA